MGTKKLISFRRVADSHRRNNHVESLFIEGFYVQ
jgi:hypothetical protein